MVSLKYGCVVGVCRDGTRAIQPLSIADHLEERRVLLLAVDRPGRVEDLVTTVLGVYLRKHEQLCVRRIAADGRGPCDVCIHEVNNLVGRKGKSKLLVRNS